MLQVRFPFDRSLVDLVKTLPNRRWHATERYWWVPEADVVLLVDLLQDNGFRFDAATRDLYLSLGGTATIDDSPPSTRPSLPGLFDNLEAPGDERATGAVQSGDYTVATLNERVREIIEAGFPAPVWLVGEISGFNRRAHKRTVGFELVERNASGEIVSKISATLFDSDRRSITRELRGAGDPFRLEDEVSVRVKTRVDLYVPWGQYRVVVEGIDLQYTLGEAARRREEIILRLTEAGLIGRNTALALPPLPLRVGLITSLGSDAYNDVVRTLNDSGYAFAVTAHGARVQGHATEPSVLNALDWFRERVERFDVILICRGGGSRTDLAWFDSEKLGRAVATFPLPVIVGIGHEKDHSVLDAVGRRCKTPTAAAGMLVETVRASIERLESAIRKVLDTAGQQTVEERRRGAERARRLVHAARSLLLHERTRLEHRRQRSVLGTRSVVSRARETLRSWTLRIPRAASVRLGVARQGIGRGALALGPAGGRAVLRENERLDARMRRLTLVDPRRVLQRGYAILRLADGRVVTSPELAPSGSAVRAQLKRGILKLRSEGKG